MLRASERRVLAHDAHSNGERAVSRREADALVAAGHYQASSGAPLVATHWRRRMPDGSCLHLVIEAQGCRLHHDAFDPRASLLSLGLHMSHEARAEAAAFAALAWSTVSLLSR